MPFQRPTPQQLRDRMAGEIEAALPGADARTRRSIEGVLARMMAIASHELHGHQDWIARQVLVDTADAEDLARHASLCAIDRRAAVTAAGPVTFTAPLAGIVPPRPGLPPP